MLKATGTEITRRESLEFKPFVGHIAFPLTSGKAVMSMLVECALECYFRAQNVLCCSLEPVNPVTDGESLAT